MRLFNLFIELEVPSYYPLYGVNSSEMQYQGQQDYSQPMYYSCNWMQPADHQSFCDLSSSDYYRF